MPHPYTGQKKIKEILYKVLEPTLENQGWYLSKLMMNWEHLVGAQLKDHLWPVRYAPDYKDRSQGILHLKVTHMGMQQLSYNKGYLIEKCNLFLGATAIKDLRAHLRHQPISVPKRPTLQSHIIRPNSPEQPILINDDQLRAALTELSHLLK